MFLSENDTRYREVASSYMKKLALIYNPTAGDKSFALNLDSVVNVLQLGGFDVCVHRSESSESMLDYVDRLKGENIDTVVVCGGDGSINIIINAVMEAGLGAKLGIIPVGTANDFAAYLGISKNPVLAAETIANRQTEFMDLGKVNDKYFMNVFAAGYPADVSNSSYGGAKNLLGKMAYYMRGAQELQSFTPITVDITNSERTFREELMFALVLNGTGAGGFMNLTPGGSPSDGLLDFLAIRKRSNFAGLPQLLIKIMRGTHLDDDSIVHFRDNFIKLESFGKPSTNIDGEEGPPMSVVIKNIPKAIEVYVPKGQVIKLQGDTNGH